MNRSFGNLAVPATLSSRRRGDPGQVGLIPEHSPDHGLLCHQSQMKLTSTGRELIRYFVCTTCSARHRPARDSTVERSDYRRTAHQPVDSFSSYQIPLPPLPTQRKIAAILSAYDDLIENNNRRIKLLEEMAQRIYREWFVDFRYPGHEDVPLVDSELGPIPDGVGGRVAVGRR